ncbi:MAG: glutathione peroxidase [Myxococcales bacterium]|jgi:glutathione peroxidase|nr:glutathione peroxidase [Myxococcales bacterium]MBL0193113.1 glutathione peroxidase [Myxococcales bacterium]HQY61228.1 glutathione peroxidase [Polyangiaceae bacterium]
MLKKVVEAASSAVNRAVYGKAPEGGPEALAGIPFTRLDGSPLPADELAGKVVLFVNVASRCGLTPQYEGLVELYAKYRERGFLVVGAPCNQFLGQEPGSEAEIASFCSATYGVDFPLLAKQDVNGASRSPLYQFLVGSSAGGGADIGWNFEKFLVGRDGGVLKRFSPKTPPAAPEVVAAIEAAL